MRVTGFTLPLAAALATMSLAGCGGQTASSPLPYQGSMAASSAQRLPITNVAFDDSDTVGINLTGQKAVKTVHYGKVLGYFFGGTVTKSAVVTIAMGSSVTFSNLDSSLPHTAALLGKATKKHAPWPTSFTGGTTKSAAGTDISTSGFTTGTLSAHTSSAIYAANVPGFYMFGCAFHYVTHHMRTVIIVK